MTSGPERYETSPGYPVPPPRKAFCGPRWVWILGSMLGTILALAAIGCSPRNPTSAPSTVTKTVTVSPTAAAPAPAPTGTKPNVSPQAMAEWRKRTVPHFRKAYDALKSLEDCDDVACLKPGCQTAHDALTVDLKAELPSPDPRVTDALNAAINEFDKGMHLCLELPANPTQAQLARVDSHMDRAGEHLDQALAIVDEYLGTAT